MIKKIVGNNLNNFLKKFNYQITKIKRNVINAETPIDLKNEKEFLQLYKKCETYSMTSIERMFALYNSVKYIVKNNIPGDFVESGVWRGGSSMLMALTLKALNESNRKIYLYDTYEGMVEPTEKDINCRNNSAQNMLKKERKDKNMDRTIWCYCPIEDVKNNLFLTGYNKDNLIFIKGKVQETIPKNIPKQISLLRLDTDFYDSTLHELNYLYPLLAENGVLIIDDYGHWKGSREAVNEYFKNNSINILLNRIDYTGRLVIKKS